MPPLFDFDLKRVSREHYITDKASINFPHPGTTTGEWHFLSYFDRESGGAKVSLAGIHDPDTTGYFGEVRVRGLELEASADVTESLKLVGSYTYNDSEIIEGAAAEKGNRMNQLPRNQATGWADYTWRSGLQLTAKIDTVETVSSGAFNATNPIGSVT